MKKLLFTFALSIIFGALAIAQEPTLENVAKGKTIHSSSMPWEGTESPDYLIDGVQIPDALSEKWCVTGKQSPWAIIDLEDEYKLSQFKVFDCGHKEEPTDNFKNYRIELSKDGTNWTEVVKQTNIPATAEYNTKEASITPTVARYVRFNPFDQYEARTIRIWEFEAVGYGSNVAIDAKEDKSVNINTTTAETFSYSMGGEEQAENFAYTVVSSNSTAEITNVTIEDGKIKFDIKTGNSDGKTDITATIINGDFTKTSKFTLTVVDPTLSNLLPGLTPTVITAGEGVEEVSGPITDINDEDQETWWTSPYDEDNYESVVQTIFFDLKEKHIINSIKGIFRSQGWIYLPLEFKAYIADVDEAGSYNLIAETSIPSSSSYPTYEVVLKPSASVSGRFLKFELTTDDGAALSIRELQVWGKKDNPTGIFKPTTSTFDIYPNPVKAGETLHFAVEKGSSVRIMTLQGATVVSQTTTSELANINTSNLVAGTYIVSVQNNGAIKTAKLIVK